MQVGLKFNSHVIKNPCSYQTIEKIAVFRKVSQELFSAIAPEEIVQNLQHSSSFNKQRKFILKKIYVLVALLYNNSTVSMSVFVGISLSVLMLLRVTHTR